MSTREPGCREIGLDEVPPIPRRTRKSCSGGETVHDAGPHRWRVDARGIRVYILYHRNWKTRPRGPWKLVYQRHDA